MCGIAGFIETPPGTKQGQLEQTALGMADALKHRGPDSTGTWVDERDGIAFGHTRLAVVDLSASGHQPMHSRDGRWVVNFNGEIYNHPALRANLIRTGAALRGSSDTEVLTELIARDGVREAISRLNGMFAIAVWDRRERALWLIRDRMGEKPLYAGWFGNTLVFGSELKAVKRHPKFDAEVDRAALAAYMRAGYVPSPSSIYTGVMKVPPAHLLRVHARGEPGTLNPERYWDLKEIVGAGLSDPFTLPDEEMLNVLDHKLRESIRIRMIADVPVGAFLSGGIDSSLVTSLMQVQMTARVQTFTIGFTDHFFDEAPFARKIAQHLGTEHRELYVDPQTAMEVVPSLPTIYDEPFADSSQIPTFLISRLARQQVTVALSGDGGDELFAGYDRFRFHDRVGKYLNAVPRSVRDPIGRRIQSVDPIVWDRLGQQLGRATGGRARRFVTPSRMQKLARLLQLSDERARYVALLSLWNDPAGVVNGAESPTLLTQPDAWLDAEDPIHTFMWLDLSTYLPDDLLTKVDRAAMAVSLETRLPLLDPDLIAAVWRFPLYLKVRDGRAKWGLKEVLARYVPLELFDRPKQGFSVPLGTWLKGPLREWAENLVDPRKLRQQQFFDVGTVRQVWQEHLDGRQDFSAQLWAVLMFQAWLEQENATTGGARSRL